MFFYQKLKVDQAAVLQALGYGPQGIEDKHEHLRFIDVAEAVERAGAPRWNYARFALAWQDGQPVLQPVGLVLGGSDIARHLEGCGAVFLAALTLGSGVEQDIRAAEATNVARAVLYDMCASVLVEQYADAVEAELRQAAAKTGEFCTSRFSPGYGDLPITLQAELLRLVDAPRTIGLTANESSILLPRKSVTMLMGIADHEVTGRLAGCDHCTLREKCPFPATGSGALCGRGTE